MEVLDENEWWNKMERMKGGVEQEMIIKRNYSRADQQTLADMASQLELYFHPYNKGKTLVVSKVPLPNYRADLDERHGSTQKEIRMSTETERRVGSLLDNSMKAAPTIASGAVSSERAKQSSSGVTAPKPVPTLETDSAKEKVNAELKERQDRMRQGSSLKEMQAFREKLPAFKMRAEFLKAVAKNQGKNLYL